MKLRSGNFKAMNESLATMGATSRRIEYLPPELWSMVGELLHGFKTLQSLVLVSHAFRDVFKPLLHSFCRIKLGGDWPKESGSELLRPTLVHTKEVEVFRTGVMSARVARETRALVLKMLAEMTLLQSFRWTELPCCNSGLPQVIQLQEELVAFLRRRERPIDIYIQLSQHFCHSGAEYRALSTTIFLTGFRNLSSLEIYNLPGDDTNVRVTIERIVEVLGENPKLKRLGLATAHLRDDDNPPIALYLLNTNLLETLCKSYVQSRFKPLPLNTLRLGCGMLKEQSFTSPSVTAYLEDLVMKNTLQTLHICNSFIVLEDEDLVRVDLDWKKMNGFTSLRQLSVSRFEDEVCDWMNSAGQSVEDLIITDNYNMYDLQDCLEMLKSPNLTMLYTREECAERDGDENSDDDYFDYTSSNRTVLHRMRGRARNLARLSLSMDFATQWKGFSKRLKKLKCLTHLRIADHGGENGHYPMNSSSIWLGVRKPKDIARCYAQLAKFLCPSLRYVRISEWSWELAGSPDSCLDIYQQINARQLERSEVLAIELFAISCDDSPGCLPGLPTTTSDETYERMAARSTIISDSRAAGRDPRQALKDAGLDQGFS